MRWATQRRRPDCWGAKHGGPTGLALGHVGCNSSPHQLSTDVRGVMRTAGTSIIATPALNRDRQALLDALEQLRRQLSAQLARPRRWYKQECSSRWAQARRAVCASRASAGDWRLFGWSRRSSFWSQWTRIDCWRAGRVWSGGELWCVWQLPGSVFGCAPGRPGGSMSRSTKATESRCHLVRVWSSAHAASLIVFAAFVGEAR